MKKCYILTAALVLAAVLTSSTTQADPFDQLFRVTKVTGICTIKVDGNGGFVDIVAQKAYPYGSIIKTGRKSSAIITFSDDNTCRVLANATITLAEGATDRKLKIIRLDEGKVEISLEEKFHENGDMLNVETATAICGAIGCVFTVESRSEEDLNVVVVVIDDGEVRVSGGQFDSVLGDKDAVTISSSADKTFTRLKIVKGGYDLKIKDSQGNEKVIEASSGTIVKIWRRHAQVGDFIVITILVTKPDGTLETFTYSEPIGDNKEEFLPSSDGGKDSTDDGSGSGDGDDQRDPVGDKEDGEDENIDKEGNIEPGDNDPETDDTGRNTDLIEPKEVDRQYIAPAVEVVVAIPVYRDDDDDTTNSGLR